MGNKLVLSALFALCISLYPASAQYAGCRTSPVGAVTSYCASEAFVTKSKGVLATGKFSSLAACNSSIEGSLAGVTDSMTNTWGATITGSGSNHVMAYCDGTNWTVAGK